MSGTSTVRFGLVQCETRKRVDDWSRNKTHLEFATLPQAKTSILSAHAAAVGRIQNETENEPLPRGKAAGRLAVSVVSQLRAPEKRTAPPDTPSGIAATPEPSWLSVSPEGLESSPIWDASSKEYRQTRPRLANGRRSVSVPSFTVTFVTAVAGPDSSRA